MTVEERAIEVGQNKAELVKRLKEARGCLIWHYRKMFQKQIVDFDNKRMVSDDGTHILQWSLRFRPNEPPSYDNQQTSRGCVQIFELKEPLVAHTD